MNDLHKRLRKDLRLTRGERLVVIRRGAGYTQAEMAAKLGVGVDKLRAWERDLGDCPRKIANVRTTELPLSELLRIRRERLGLRISYIARVMERSVGWVHRAHTGEHEESAERLTNFILAKEKRA